MTADQSHGPHCANCHTEFALDGSCACSWPTADRTGGEAPARVSEPVWREARRVQPGWYVRMEGEWHEVRLLMEFGGDPGRRGIRGVRIDTVDGFTASCDASAEVATLTAREAKRAGVVA